MLFNNYLFFYILPGAFFNEKISSEVIVNFPTLGISSKNVGLPPTEIKIYFAVTVSTFPLEFVSYLYLKINYYHKKNKLKIKYDIIYPNFIFFKK